MLLKIIFSCLVFLSVVFLQQSDLFVSQAQQLNPEVGPFTDLTFEIDTLRKPLSPLQPIPITLKQSNRTNRPVLGYKSIGFGKMPVYLYVQKIGSNKRTVIGQFIPVVKLIAYKNTEIAPGTSYEAKEWITLGLNIDFPEFGGYEIQAVLLNDDGTQSIQSNKIHIEIQEPVGTDREVYNLINNSPSKEYLFSGGDFEKTKPILETIKTSFPNSNYAKSAIYVLGERHFVLKQYPKALVNLIKLEHDDDIIFAHKVRDYLSEIRRIPQGQQIQEKEQ